MYAAVPTLRVVLDISAPPAIFASPKSMILTWFSGVTMMLALLISL
jgi:hypothetical protein